MNSKQLAYLYIISGAALWGLIGLFVKILAAQGFSSMEIVALRSLASALCTSLLLFKLGKKALAIELKDCWMFIGTGILSLTFFNYCYFNCIQGSSLAVAALLLYTAPIFVMLMSIALFGESFTKVKCIALVMTFLGCGCITGAFSGQLNLTIAGLLYGLGSGFGYALYSIFGKYAVRKYSSPTITAYTFYFSALAAVPLADFGFGTVARINGDTLLAMAGLGFICALIPYILYTKGLEQVDAGQASILATIEPFVAALVGVLCFGEPVTWQKLLGMGLIFIAIVLLNLPAKHKA